MWSKKKKINFLLLSSQQHEKLLLAGIKCRPNEKYFERMLVLGLAGMKLWSCFFIKKKCSTLHLLLCVSNHHCFLNIVPAEHQDFLFPPFLNVSVLDKSLRGSTAGTDELNWLKGCIWTYIVLTNKNSGKGGRDVCYGVIRLLCPAS